MEAVIDEAAVPWTGEPETWGESLRGPFAALAAGDVEALEAVWDVAGRRLYAVALWRTGNDADARDVVQDVFVRLAARRGELGRVARPHLWLLAVAHRAAIDLTRRRAVRSAESLSNEGGAALLVAAEGPDPEKGAEAARVSEALRRLPPPQREAVSLRHLAGHSFREVAEITGVPTFTAASRCRLGLARLRRLLERPR